MAVLKPFRCVRPAPGQAEKTASLPYDVFNEREARIETAANPLSFLNIDRPETQFPEGTDPCGEEVYQMAKELFEEMIRQGIYVEDGEEAYYIYELTMGGRSQTGVVGCAAVDDYLSGVIKKHENTREEKEQDRIRHVDALNAQTGPIFLAYRASEAVSRAVERYKSGEALCDFTAADGVRHRVWKVSGEERIRNLEKLFAAIPAAYIADGHHRAASAVKVCLKRREEHPGYTGEEPFNYFLSVLFPHDQLRILPYNRVVTDWNGLTEEELLEKIRENFLAEKVGKKGESPFQPERKGEFGMLMGEDWYRLEPKPEVLQAVAGDPVRSLDVSVLQEYLLGPVLFIGDPRISKRIDFVGGIRGVRALEERVGADMALAFSLYATSVEELFAVADAGLLMPPKSTWFEPKLRSGLFIHRLE